MSYAPKGYSLNHYPQRFSSATHKIVVTGRVPVYNRYFEGVEQPSPSQNPDSLHTFLDNETEVIVVDEHIGSNGSWSEIMIPGDANASEYNLFIFNNKSRPVLQRLPLTRPSARYSQNINTRDYSRSIFSYDNRASNHVFHDALYQHYVIKISQTLNSSMSIDEMLQNAIVQGAKKICSEYGVLLPEYTYEYLSERLFDFFNIFHYTLDIRGNSNVNISSLVCYVTIRTKYLEPLFPNLVPTTEEIAAQDPQYRRAEEQGIRVNEHIDPWLDPARSPLDAENFVEQYIKNFKDQTGKDLNFAKVFEDIYARGIEKPLNLPNIIAEEFSETPLIGSSWQDNQRNQADRARSQQAVAQQDLERAVGKKIDDMFAALGLTPARTREARKSVRAFTSAVVSIGAGIEDVNDMIDSVVDTLKNTPDIVNLQTGEVNISPSQLISLIGAEMDPGLAIAALPQANEEQAERTLAASFEQKQALSRYFDQNQAAILGDASLTKKYPLLWQKDNSSLSKVFIYDNIFSLVTRKGKINELQKNLSEEILKVTNPNEPSILGAEYESALLHIIEKLFEQDFNSFSGTPTPGSPIETYYNNKDLVEGVKKELVSLLDIDEVRLNKIETEDGKLQRETIENIIKIASALEETYTDNTNELPFLSKKDSMELYTVASNTIGQSVIYIPIIRIKTNNDLEFLNKTSSPSSNKEFSGLKGGLSDFYSAAKVSIEIHEEKEWKIKNLSSSKIDGIEKGVNKMVREVLKGLIKSNIPSLLKKPKEEPKDIDLKEVYLSLAYDKSYSLTFASLSCTMPSRQKYITFAFSGAANENYDIDKITPSVTYDEAVGQQLFLYNIVSDYKNGKKHVKEFPSVSALNNLYSAAWRKIISNLFSRTKVEFISPSERPEIINRNAAYRTFYQNTKGRTERKQKAVIKSIREFQGGVPPDSSNEETKRSTDSTRKEISDLSIPLTRAGEDAFSASFSSTEELSTELISHIGFDTPLLDPFIKCLFPEINLGKILQDAELFKLIKDMQDSILAVVESAGAALDLYNTLEVLFTPSEGSGGLKGMFLAALDKVIDLLILEAFKAALQYIQTLCLRWQAFLMDMITQALLGNAIEESPISGGTTGRQLPGTTGSTSSIGNGVIASLALKGYTQGDIEILSSPEAIRYIEDLSNLLTPSEFCQLLTKDESPEYLRDVAYTLYEELYKDTILSQLDDKTRLYSFLRVMGEFVDPAVCETLSMSSRLPERGYSHISQNCSDSERLSNIKDRIIEGTAINPDELRKILDNTSAKNAQDIKTMLAEIEAQASGTSKINLDPDKIFEELPEVKKIRKDALLMTNSDLVNALTLDANIYSDAITESGKEYYKEVKYDLVLGPMGKIYRQFAIAQINEKLKLSKNYSSDQFDESVGVILNNIIQREDDGSYTFQDKGALAVELRNETGLEFNEKDIEIIRISNVRSRQKVFNNIRSADSESDSRNPSYDVEGLERFQYDYQKQKFLDNVRQYLDTLTYEEKESIIEQLKVCPWKIAIGIYDNQGQRNVYYTNNSSAEWPDWLIDTGDKSEVMKYLPGRSEKDYSYMVPLYFVRPQDNVTPESLYGWLEESTNKTADYFFAKYKDEEGKAKAAHVIFISSPLLNRDGSFFYINPEPLQNFGKISIIKEPTQSLVTNSSRKFKVYSNGDFDIENLSDNFIKIDKNENLKKDNPENYSRDKFFLYREGGKKYAGGIIRGINSEKKIKSEISPNKAGEERVKLIKKNIRDIVWMKRENLFGITSSTTTQEEQERELLHFLMKQSEWFSHTSNETDVIYGQKIFKMLNSVRESFTEYQNNGDYKNLLPDIIKEHLLGMLSIEKHLSDYENLKEKFKSPVDFVDPSAEFERRDYSVEEKVDMWLSMKFFILTFVADYYLKMLPMIMSTDFFKDSQNELSKQIILGNIEVFLQEDRGHEFDIFRVKFFYYVNVFWLFIRQEKCSKIDITSFKNPMTAVSNIVEEAISEIQSYLNENNLVNSINNTNNSNSKVISVKDYGMEFSAFGDISAETKEKENYRRLADSYGNQVLGYSLDYTLRGSTQGAVNQFGNFKEKLISNGMILIVPEILEVQEDSSGETIQTKISFSDFIDRTTARNLVDNRSMYHYSYKISVSLRFLMPEQSIITMVEQWTKTEAEHLELGVFKQQRFVDLETIESSVSFFDTKDPLGNGKDIYDCKITEITDYIAARVDRLNEEHKKLEKIIKDTRTYKLIDETINILGNGEESSIMNSLIYYSMYDYFDKLGHRTTFNNTRAAAMNKFLKADARGTKYTNIALNDPQGESEAGEGSQELTFYEHWSQILDLEEWRETPVGAAETVEEEILENYPNADPAAVKQAKGEAYAQRKDEQAEQALANGDVAGYRAAKQEAGEVRAATTQGDAAEAQGQSTGNSTPLNNTRTDDDKDTLIR